MSAKVQLAAWHDRLTLNGTTVTTTFVNRSDLTENLEISKWKRYEDMGYHNTLHYLTLISKKVVLKKFL